ncbi:MAG: hypothetical protein PHH96_06005 [Smithellaceae bacterium]|nr:hypothetical protein [Smithellaceae bacterium]
MTYKKCPQCQTPVKPTDADTCPFCSQSLDKVPQLDDAAFKELFPQTVASATTNHDGPKAAGNYRKAGLFLAVVIGIYCQKVLGYGWWLSYGIALVLGSVLYVLFGSMRKEPDKKSFRVHLIGIGGIAGAYVLSYAVGSDDSIFITALLAGVISFVVQLVTRHNTYSFLTACLGGAPATIHGWWVAQVSRGYHPGFDFWWLLLAAFVTLCQCVPVALLIWFRK